jgi:hypothetical protein
MITSEELRAALTSFLAGDCPDAPLIEPAQDEGGYGNWYTRYLPQDEVEAAVAAFCAWYPTQQRPTLEERAQEAVRHIVADLCDRNGLENAWDEIRPEQQAHIQLAWQHAIVNTFEDDELVVDQAPAPPLPPPSWPVESIEELLDAIERGALDPDACEAWVDSNELNVMGAGGVTYFSGVVEPEDVAWLLGITDVNQV